MRVLKRGLNFVKERELCSLLWLIYADDVLIAQNEVISVLLL